jgi:hypothetical protein
MGEALEAVRDYSIETYLLKDCRLKGTDIVRLYNRSFRFVILTPESQLTPDETDVHRLNSNKIICVKGDGLMSDMGSEPPRRKRRRRFSLTDVRPTANLSVPPAFNNPCSSCKTDRLSYRYPPSFFAFAVKFLES